MQEQALRILVAAAAGKVLFNGGAALEDKLLPACLAALSAPVQAVRQQALAFCSAAASSETNSWLPANDLVGKSTIKQLMNAISVHATAITADPAAAAAVFWQAHAPGAKQKKAGPARYAMDHAKERSLSSFTLSTCW